MGFPYGRLQHYNISTGADDVALAKLFLDNFNVKAFKSEKLGVKSRAKITFEALGNQYLVQGKPNGLRSGTIKQYSAARDRFRTFLEKRGLAGADMQSLTPAIIEDYNARRRLKTCLSDDAKDINTVHAARKAGRGEEG